MVIVIYLLLGPLLLTLSVYFKIKPPARINHIYGYRTRRSMRDQTSWDEANAFSASLMVLVSILLNIFQAVCYLFLPGEKAALTVCVVMVLGLLLVIPLTENHLKQKFGE